METGSDLRVNRTVLVCCCFRVALMLQLFVLVWSEQRSLNLTRVCSWMQECYVTTGHQSARNSPVDTVGCVIIINTYSLINEQLLVLANTIISFEALK